MIRRALPLSLLVFAFWVPDAGACVSCMVDEQLGINTCIEDLITGWDECYFIVGFLPCEEFGENCEEWNDLLVDGTTSPERDDGTEANLRVVDTARGRYLVTCGSNIASRELSSDGLAEIRGETSHIAI